MSTPRPTRGSRVSSPYVGTPAAAPSESQNSNTARAERPRTFMDKWVEPPLPAPRPSFAEAGIERHGVVQNMAPLGTRPSSKMMKAVTARLESDGLGRTNIKRAATSTVTTPGESAMTPEPFSNPLPVQPEERSETPEVRAATKAPEEPASPVPSMSRSSVPPQSNGQGVFSVHKSPVPASRTTPTTYEAPVLQNTTPYAAPAAYVASPYSTPAPSAAPINAAPVAYAAQTPAPVHHSPYPPAQTPTPSTLTPLVVPPLPMDDDGLPSINLELTDKIVEKAVQDAIDSLKYPTAYALRTLYDDHRKNKRIVRLIEAVYNGRGTDRDFQEFNIIMRKKKREGKKDRTGEYYFNGDGSDPAPAQHSYAAALQVVNPPAQPYKTPYSALPPRPSTANSVATDPQVDASSIAPASMPASPQVATNDPDEHIDKKLKMGNVLPSLELNGHGEASANGTKMSQSPTPNGMINSTPKRVRLNSESSSSSLSSIDENLLGEGVLSAGVSPARPVSSRLGPGSIGLGFLGNSAPRFISPYASANNFAAVASGVSASSSAPAGSGVSGVGIVGGSGASVAENVAHNSNQGQPITRQASSAPKAPQVSAAKAPRTRAKCSSPSDSFDNNSPSSTHILSTTTHNNTTIADHANNHDTSSSLSASNNNMAPAALLSQESLSSSDSAPVAAAVPAKFLKTKNGHGPTVIENEEVRKRKREAREKSNKYVGREESYVRSSTQGAPAVQEPESASDVDSGAPPPKRRAQIRLNVKKPKQHHTRNHPEEEPDSSPTTLGFRPDIAPGSVNTSRAGTPPLLTRRTRKTKAAGSGLRLKSSPIKKKGGTSAGLPKESGPKSPSGTGATSNQEEIDNNDFCSACGGNGDLVCCDGCVRSFHNKCCDPPLADDVAERSGESWYCNKCQAKDDDSRGWPFQKVKVFDQMQYWLEDTNPSSFHLPKDIREYFTDVKTGTEGEYEEVQPPPPPKITKKNAEEFNIDYFRKKDAKGNPVLCYSCHLSASAPDRMIIPCSFCGLNWHLDCLPTPMAKEPNPLRQWRCPAHVDDLLATLPQFLGPAHRFRTIKGAPVEIPAIDRGFRNSGHIEIENDDTDVEEEPGFFEHREFGKIYKLPEKGIALDFIAKVKQMGGGYVPSRFSARAEHAAQLKNRAHAWQSVTDSLSSRWNKSDLYRQQAALNLAAMATSTPEIEATGGLNMLVDTLLTEAPPAAVAMIGRGDALNIAGAGKLSNEERASLKAMKARIDSRLDADSVGSEVATDPTFSDPITSTDDADTTMSMDDEPAVEQTRAAED